MSSVWAINFGTDLDETSLTQCESPTVDSRTLQDDQSGVDDTLA